MTIVTIVAKYETTADEIIPFAMSKGWQEKVINPTLDEDTNQIVYGEIDNPESALDFCNRKAKECLIDFLMAGATEQLQKAKTQEAQAGIAVIKQRVSDALTVNQGE